MFLSPRRNSVARACVGLLALALCQWLYLSDAFAASLNDAPLIFDMRKSLPLEPDDPVFHDFYINAGPEAGFKKGMFITAVRLVPVHDPVMNKQQGELQVNIARLKVIHVGHGLTVARLEEDLPDEDRPALEYEAVMIGDRIDPSSMTMESPSAPKKKTSRAKRAEQPLPAPQAPVAEAPANVAKPAGPLPGVPVAESKNASQPASAPAMVRVPVPSEPAQD